MVTPYPSRLLQQVFAYAKRAMTSEARKSARAPSRCLPSVQGACHAIGGALCVAVLVVATQGCSPRYHDMPAYWPIPTREYDNYGPGRFKTSYLAEQIERHYRGSAPGPIGVTTFVNIDDLYTTSTFGRMVGEQLMSELSMKGFDVIELRHSDALQFLDSTGEFALSRDVRVVRPERNLAAVVVGTYVSSPDRVYLNARLVDPSTSLVVSAGSVEMTKTRELAKLLRGGSIPASLERIPVRHLGPDSYAFNPFDPVRRRWEMEESGMGAQPQIYLPPREAFAEPPARRRPAPQPQTERSEPQISIEVPKSAPVIEPPTEQKKEEAK